MSFTIDNSAKYCIIGYGSWATAIAKILTDNGNGINWFVANPDVREKLVTKGRNPKYLRDVHFNRTKITLFSDIDDAVGSSDVVILAVPSAFLVTSLDELEVPLEGKFIVSAIKGIIPGDYITIAEFVNRRYQVAFDRIGIITGPCHSEEIALERLSYLTFASKSLENAQQLCSVFSNQYVMANPSTDIYGAEYAAVLKNIYAICAGMAVGLGYGDNFLAVLVSNASIEMNRFLERSYPFDRNTSASAYLGDLLVTCYSQFSRNRTFGAMVGKGYGIKSAMAEMNMVAEGYFASECIRQVNNRFGIPMPIADAVHRILYEGEPAGTGIRNLTLKLT